MITYAGIGSRTTPPHILEQMKEVAIVCAQKGFVLHSGGASGADSAFELAHKGAGGQCKIFLPWKNHNGNDSALYPPHPRAFEIARQFHPCFGKLLKTIQPFIARNMHQILDESLDRPVRFVVCYTPNGQETSAEYTKASGGTGSAINVADHYNVPVFNLRNIGRYEDVLEFIDMIKE